MIALTDVFAVLGVALAMSSGALGAYRFLRHQSLASLAPPFWVRAVTGALFIALIVPRPGSEIPLAAFFRGFSGDLSITLLVLCGWSLCRHLLGLVAISPREWTALMVVVAAAALLLYPTALGWGNWDAYRLGWGSWWLWSSLALLSVFSWLMGLRVVTALVALALLAWSLGLNESGNLWDYLMDPWLSAYALFFVFIKCTSAVFKRLRQLQ